MQTSGIQSASTEEWMGEKSQSKRWKGPAPCPAAQLSVKEADQRPPYGKLRCRGKGDRRKVRQKAIHSTKNALVPGTLVLACLPMIPCGPHGDILPVMSPHIPFIGLCLLPLRQRSFLFPHPFLRLMQIGGRPAASLRKAALPETALAPSSQLSFPSSIPSVDADWRQTSGLLTESCAAGKGAGSFLPAFFSLIHSFG